MTDTTQQNRKVETREENDNNQTEKVVVDKSSSGSPIAGAILLVFGILLSFSLIGALVGVPLSVIGFSLIFPRFTKYTIIIAAILFFVVLLSI